MIEAFAYDYLISDICFFVFFFNFVLCDFQEEKTRGKVPDFAPNIVMLGLSPSEFVLKTISKEKTNDLEHILLVSFFSPN